MAYPSPRRLQLRRGNAAAIASYLGYAGELVVDTSSWTLYVHDGVTVGGYAATVNTATLTTQITSVNANITIANVGMKGYVDQANTIQSAQVGAANLAIIAANLGMKGYVDSVASQSIYSNSNVKSYLTGGFDGNIVPSANAVYSLGSVTNQWKSLFVSNSTIYVGGVPLSIDATGNLTVNGNIIPTIAYVNAQVANVTVDLSSYALNANVTAANVGLKGYVDQANSIQSSAISSANIAIKGYIDQQITDLIGGAPSILDTLNEIAASINDDANVYTSLINSIATANTALKGYVDQANTIQSSQMTAANTGMRGYVDATIAANIANISIPTTYSNANVASYLPTYSGNIAANISKAGYTWTFGSTGTLTVPANGIITAPINQEFQLQAKAADSVLRNEINLDPNNGTYMSVWSDELNTSFSTGAGSWVTASWNNEDGFGAARFTGAEDLQNFWTTGPGSFVDSVEVSINGGARGRAGYEGNNGGGYGVYLSVDQVPPGGQGTTVPITSLVFYFRTKNRIDIDYLNGQLLLNTQSMNINLETNSYINLKSTRANPVRIITNNNTHMWEFDSAGSLTLPREGKIYGIGQGAASDRYGYISWAGNSSGDGSGFNTMRLVPDQQGLEDADQYIIIDPTGGEPGHIHIRAGGTQDNSGAHLYLGGENSHVKISAGANPPVTVLANNNAWTFGTDGTTTFSGNLVIAGNTNVFGTNGALIQPANDLPLLALSSGANGAVSSIWVEDIGNIGTSNIAAVYANPTVGSKIVRIAVGQNGGAYGPNLWDFDTDGNLTLPNVASVSINYANGVSILSGLGGGGSSYSNVQVAAYLTTATINTTGNITAGNLFTSGALYVANITTTGASGNISGANYITANYFVGNGALLTGITAVSSYSNVQVATYLPTYDGVVTAGNVAVNGNVTAQYFLGNGAFLTGIVGGAGNYGNIDVKAFLETDAGFADGFQRVIEGYYSNIILGDSTKLFSFGNSSKSYFGHDGFLGNASINYIRADNGDVRIATNNAAYTWIFDRDGNLTLSGNTFSVNYANGTPVTFSSSSYSNVQVATYLPTYSGNVSALNFVGAIQAQVGSSFAYATDAYGSLFVSGGVALPADTNSNAIVAGYTIVGNSGAVTLTVTSATFIPGTPNIVQVATTPTASSLAFPVTVYTANYSPAKSSTITVGNATVSGNVTATYFLGNGALLTGIVGGAGNYGNIDVKAFLATGDGVSRLIQGYYANLDLGATARLYSYGSSAASFFGHDGFANVNINYVRAGQGDIQIATNNGDHNWTFSNAGNLTLPAGGRILESTYLSADSIILKPNGGTSTQYLEIAPTAVDGNHVHLMTGSGTELFLGDDNHYVKLANTGGVVINSNDGTGNTAQWTFGKTGTTQFPGSKILAPAGESITMWSDNYSQLMWENANLTVAPNMAINSNFYVAQNNATLDIGYRDGSSTQIIKSWYWNADGNLKLPSGGYILNSDDSIYGGGSSYSNVEVAAYLPTYSGALQSSNVQTTTANIQSLTASTNNATGALRVMGGVGVGGNVSIKLGQQITVGIEDPSANVAFPERQAIFIANANVASGINVRNFSTSGGASSNYVAVADNNQGDTHYAVFGIAGSGFNAGGPLIAPNDAYLSTIGGNLIIISGSSQDTVIVGAGGTVLARFRSTTANVSITASAVSTSTTTGALTVSGGVGVAGNLNIGGNVTANTGSYFVGNGAFLTGIVASGGNYSNVDVANYLPTYTGNLAAANLLMSSRTINSTSTTVDLFNDTTLNINAFGAATDINIGVNNAAARFGIKTPNIWFDNLANLATYSSNINVFNTTATGVNAFGAANTIVFGANTSSTTFRGNVTAANFIGNISITGNVTGTSANVTLQAGSYSSTFDNQGNVRLPTAYVTGNVTANYFVGSGSLLSGVAIKTTGSWTVPTGNSTQSFTVPTSGTYQLWVDCNIPNGILAWNATATVTNSNVPVVGAQYAWVYNGGGTPIDFTSIPNQFVGTGNTIVRSSVSPSVTTNRFDFGINNTSGGNVTVSYGYVKIS